MDAEIIKAIGQYVVSPICFVVVAWLFFRAE